MDGIGLAQIWALSYAELLELTKVSEQKAIELNQIAIALDVKMELFIGKKMSMLQNVLK